MSRTALVVGASGIVGNAAVEKFIEDGYEVIALSRRPPESNRLPRLRHVAVDLRDPKSCRDVVATFGSVTHVVYAALYEKPGLIAGWVEDDQMQTNLSMLQNVLGPLLEVADELRHVSLLQGTKAYGVHLHPIRIPARERFPRDPNPNFYWLQEDYLREKADEFGFNFSIWRPTHIVGPNHGVAMNAIPVIAAYAAICRHLGRPCGFPGGVSHVQQSVDTRLIANALAWGANSPQAASETFNLTDGDVFEWRDLWPMFMSTLGVEVGPDIPVSMVEFLPAHAGLWDKIVAKHGLRKVTMPELLGESHYYTDRSFAYGISEPLPPALVSTVKVSLAGFMEVRDSAETWRYWLQAQIDRGLVPPV